MAKSPRGAAPQRLRGLGDLAYHHGDQAPRQEVYLRPGPQGEPQAVGAREFVAEVAAVAKGLIGVGVAAGDRVVIAGVTGYAAAVLVQAVWVARAVAVVVEPAASAARLAEVLRDCRPAAVVLGDGRHAQAVARAGRELTDLARVWRLDEEGLAALARPGAYMDSTAVRFRREEQNHGDPAAIVYPPTTTGQVRGAVLTHGALLAGAQAALERLAPARSRVEDGAVPTVLVELPLSGAAGLVALVACALARARVCPVERGANEDALLRAASPHVVVCRGRLLSRLYARERAIAHETSWDNLNAFTTATDLAVQFDQAPRKGPWRRVSRAMYEWMYSRMREALGGRAVLVVCAAGTAEPWLDHFFNGAGVELVQAWGTDESGGVVAAGVPGRRRGATAGPPLEGVEVRLAGDGEVYVRGPGVFSGYWGDEAAGRAARWEDWVATGAVAGLDEAGRLVPGRRLRPQAAPLPAAPRQARRTAPAGPPPAAPAPEQVPEPARVWERRVCAHPLIAQAMVIARGRPYPAALLTLSGDQLEYWRLVNNRPLAWTREELVMDAELAAEVRGAVVEANGAVEPAWAVRAFHVLAEEFSPTGGLVLPDGRLRRDAVLRAFAEEIEGLYRSPQPGR
ncbi:AMP-binding protein [Streptomonospora nanhaiensis]|uniref:AMP-binding protein n=1 Tax=Streptomonospora nanhaiensis TaxID=1323731 RepID=UPI001C38462E|nr:AMP-binding protein [Streptomonospora nanhaiensis]MBV2366434.1 AMP-binding protein [Streptomonospora nanhaiensis]